MLTTMSVWVAAPALSKLTLCTESWLFRARKVTNREEPPGTEAAAVSLRRNITDMGDTGVGATRLLTIGEPLIGAEDERKMGFLRS